MKPVSAVKYIGMALVFLALILALMTAFVTLSDSSRQTIDTAPPDEEVRPMRAPTPSDRVPPPVDAQ